ncbi:MAG: hypothetical protein M1812_003938 [Candelaria pacifica]|nr:MAG: hypothetical protein M1812_003938 [Candelaria pacifica]
MARGSPPGPGAQPQSKIAMQTTEPPQKLRVLVGSTGWQKGLDMILYRMHMGLGPQSSVDGRLITTTKTVAEHSDWADLLILAPLDADHLAKMLHGIADNRLLEVLRSWDVSKNILLIPSMTIHMWENPMTKKQLNKIRRKWNWIRVLPPLLIDFDHDEEEEILANWEGMEEFVDAIKHQVDLMNIGQDTDAAMSRICTVPKGGRRSFVRLPPEIWTVIFEYVGDWELAKAAGVYTNLSIPSEWVSSTPRNDLHAFLTELEWIILTGTLQDFITKLSAGPDLRYLSSLSAKLIIKLARTKLLSYLETNQKPLFWNTFGHKLLPTKASAAFGKLPVLEWWRTSPSFLTKEYTHEAVDGASKSGFVHVLEWWRKSGLPMRYSEVALEQASARGNIEVLNWWKKASMVREGYNTDSSDMNATEGPLRLKVGKSICFAAQYGQEETVRWWAESGIPYMHEEVVTKIASASGHVNVLRLWKELKGEKTIFDNQVLVGPTKNGHRDVLEWWKKSGFRVEYKTCDIEEALEDSLGGVGEEQVKVWWAKSGLNLGVGTSEWMKVKVL